MLSPVIRFVGLAILHVFRSHDIPVRAWQSLELLLPGETVPGLFVQQDQSHCAIKATCEFPGLVCSPHFPRLEIPQSFGVLSTGCGELWWYKQTLSNLEGFVAQ